MYAGYDISKIGDVFEKKLSVPFGNVAFLIAAPAVERPGVIFGYRAYIADASAMLVLHLWRPVPSTGRHRLMDVVYFSPNRTGEVDVSLIVVMILKYFSKKNFGLKHPIKKH